MKHRKTRLKEKSVAKNQELATQKTQNQQTNGLQIFAPVDDISEAMGSLPVDLNIPVIKHNYRGGLFDVPFPSARNGRMEEFLAMVIAAVPNIRRDFESSYEEANPMPPVCFSNDGKIGSHLPEQKTFNIEGQRQTHNIYGECKTCWYSQFKTDGAWNGNIRPGTQCKEYMLLFLAVVEDPKNAPNEFTEAVLQVPPTSVRVVNYYFQQTIRGTRGASLHNILWRFIGTGGRMPTSKKSESICVLPASGAPVEVVEFYNKRRAEQKEFIQEFSYKFASGGLYLASDSVPKPDAETENGMDEVDV